MVEHDLTADELQEFIKLTPKGRSGWKATDCKLDPHTTVRVRNFAVRHDGLNIVTVERWGVTLETQADRLLVRAAYETEVERRDRRKVAAKKAAETRRIRHEKEVQRIARDYVEGKRFGPRSKCVACGKKITDDQSRQRGIGSECWQGLLLRIQQFETAKEKAVSSES